jgi:DNA-binding transcriptional LysR family regulator
MDLQRLSYFRSAARLQHMTRAARELGVAQPSLSNAIRGLEAELGVELFDRKGRSVRLNPYGRIFLRHVDRVFQAIDDGRREINDMASSLQCELVVSAVALLWTVGLIKAFSRHRPDVRFRLFQRTPTEMVRQLERQEVDLCLMADPSRDTIQWTPLVSGDVYVMAPPGHRLLGRKTVSFAELGTEPLILGRSGGTLRELVDQCMREAGVAPNIVCESDDVSAMQGLVKAGLGMMFVPDLGRGLKDGTDPALVRVTQPDCTACVGVAWKKGGYHSSAAKDFADFALEYFRNGAGSRKLD